MRRLSVWTCCFILALAALGAGRHDAETDSLLGKIGDAADKLNTYSYESEHSDGGIGGSGTTSAKCVGALVRGNDACRHKFRYTSKAVHEYTPEHKVDMTQKWVSDGEVWWSEMWDSETKETRATKYTVTEKHRQESIRHMNPILWTKARNKVYALRLFGEEMLNGEVVYILAGTIREEFRPKGWWEKCLVLVGKKDLFPRKIALTGRPGSYVTEFRNVRINIDVDEKLFQYTPPEGARIEDKTQTRN